VHYCRSGSELSCQIFRHCSLNSLPSVILVFSERELVHVRYMSSPVRPSVCLLSVCLSLVCLSVCSCVILSRLKFSVMFSRHLVPWPSADMQVKFFGDRLRATFMSGELNARGVAKISILDLLKTISRKRYK